MNLEQRKEEYKYLLQNLFRNRPTPKQDPAVYDWLQDPLRSQVLEADRNLLYPLSETEIAQLAAGDGDELDWKLKQINASSALAINIFHAIKDGKELMVEGIGSFVGYELEKKLPTLKTSKAKANIDLYLKNDTTHLYIESKFTEALNKRNDQPEMLRPAYRDLGNYIDTDIYEALRPFVLRSYAYYDAIQIMRHTIAIYRDVVEHPENYVNKNVVLLNLAWEIKNVNNKFSGLFDLQLRVLGELNEFAPQFQKKMKTVFAKRGVRFQFLYMNYEDFILHQTNLKTLDEATYNYVKQRYLFQSDEEVSATDKLKYILHSLDPLQQSDFIQETRDCEIVDIITRNGSQQRDVDDTQVVSNLRAIMISHLDPLDTGYLENIVYPARVAYHSFTNYHKQAILSLQDQSNTALSFIADTIVWKGDTIRLEELFADGELLKHETDVFSQNKDSLQSVDLICREKEFYRHDFTQLRLQPYFFEQARNEGKCFILGFVLDVDGKSRIFYALNKNGQHQLYQMYYHLLLEDISSLIADTLTDFITKYCLQTNDIGIYRGHINRFYTYLKRSRKYSSFNLFLDSPIVMKIDDSQAYDQFIQKIQELIRLADSELREVLQKEYDLYERFHKLGGFYHIQRIINYLKSKEIPFEVKANLSLLWNLIYLGESVNDATYPFSEQPEGYVVDVICERLWKGTFDNDAVISIPNRFSEDVRGYIAKDITKFRFENSSLDAHYLLINKLEEAIEITPFVFTTVDNGDQECLLSNEIGYDYHRYWSRFTVSFI